MVLRSLTVPYVIVGAVATSLYMPRRETRDLDILIHTGDSEQIASDLFRAGFAKQGERSIGETHWTGPIGEELDVLESDESWVVEALANPWRSPTGEWVISLPYLVILKLTASRVQDIADVQRMLGQSDEAALDEVRGVVRRFRPEDVDDLESLIALGKLEYR